MPDIADAILSHGDSFDAEAEGPAGVFFRVDLHGFEDIRMNHSAAAKLDPFLPVGEPDVHFSRRLRKWKKARPHSEAGLRAEIGADELIDRALQIHHRHVP